MPEQNPNAEKQQSQGSQMTLLFMDAIAQLAEQVEAQTGVPRGTVLVSIMAACSATLALATSEAMRRQKHHPEPKFTRAGEAMAGFVKSSIEFFTRRNVVEVECNDPTCDCMPKRPAWGAKLVEVFGGAVAKAIEETFAAKEMAPTYGAADAAVAADPAAGEEQNA